MGAMRDVLRNASLVSLSALSWLEQVLLFSQAAVVVGVEGAGLANLIYMSEDALAVILLPAAFGNARHNFGMNAVSCGFSYYWHLAEAAGVPSRQILVEPPAENGWS